MKESRMVQLSVLIAVLLLLSSLGTPAADVEFLGVVKSQSFEQDNPTAPALVEFEEGNPDATPPFTFNVFADLSSSNAVTNATVTLPGGAMRFLESEGETSIAYFDGAEFKPDLDGVYSNGTYTVFLQTQNDGDQTIFLTFPPGDAYPNPPRISNWTAAQSIAAASDFTLTWDAFVGGLATDFIQVEIAEAETSGTVFETAGPGEPGSLNGLSNSVVLPAGTLSPGSSYRARIFFARIVDLDDTSYSGVTGVATFVAETSFEVRTTGTGADSTQPFLETSIPFNMQFGVKGSTVVSFTFNEKMNTSLSLASSISWSNATAGLFTYTWSADSRTLFCVYPPGFTLNTNIGWKLNPSGSPENLRDVAGNHLPTLTGSFDTGNETGTGETDVDFLALVKGRVFRQTSAVAESAEAYLFSLTSDLNTLNGVTNGLITLPNAAPVAPELDFGDTFDFETLYASQAQLDSFFPDGSYQVRFDTVRNGTRTFNFTLSGSAYPNAPQIQNFATTQSVNPTNSFALSWGPFTGGTTNDFIGFEIEAGDDVSGDGFETPNFNEPGALRGTNVSVTIPAYSFAPGRTYRGELFFVKTGQVDTNTYPGVIGVSGYLSITLFELQTIGETIRPSLQISASQNGGVRVVVTGEKNRQYTVESIDNLFGNPIQWMPQFVGTADSNVSGFSGSFEFLDTAPGTKRFYRAREGVDFGTGGP